MDLEFRLTPPEIHAYDSYVTQVHLDIPEDRNSDGPAMSALTDQQRAFVYLMIQTGVNEGMANQCAKAAGYEGPNGGWRCMRNERILAALREETTKRLMGAALVGVSTMIEIANSPGHKDRYKAAKDLAAINGFTPEQKITVTHVKQDERDVLDKIRERAEKLGLDPRKLLLDAGIIVDAEFTDITYLPAPARADELAAEGAAEYDW